MAPTGVEQQHKLVEAALHEVADCERPQAVSSRPTKCFRNRVCRADARLPTWRCAAATDIRSSRSPMHKAACYCKLTAGTYRSRARRKGRLGGTQLLRTSEAATRLMQRAKCPHRMQGGGLAGTASEGTRSTSTLLRCQIWALRHKGAGSDPLDGRTCRMHVVRCRR